MVSSLNDTNGLFKLLNESKSKTFKLSRLSLMFRLLLNVTCIECERVISS